PDKLVWKHNKQNHRVRWDAVEAFEFADIGVEEKFKKVAVRFYSRGRLQRRVLVIPDADTLERLRSVLKTKNQFEGAHYEMLEHDEPIVRRQTSVLPILMITLS